ncbi:MAG: OmpH family outer membrane protein [Nannocystaceae bacterium]|nr:OmpH family outer membrane protein [Nannocystaceae bacterium]
MRLAAVFQSISLALAVSVGAVSFSAMPATANAAVPAVKKLAMVDMQKVLNDTKAGRAARKKLESQGKSKAAKFEKKRNKLEADFSKLQTLKGPTLAAAQEQLQKDQLELQNFYSTMQQGLMEDEAKLTEKIYKNTAAIVKAISTEKGLDLVLVRDPMTVIYAKDGLDITTEVVKRYDAKHSK